MKRHEVLIIKYCIILGTFIHITTYPIKSKDGKLII